MKLITKSSLTFISLSVIFSYRSIVMYFSVRNIVSTNLNSILIEKKDEIIHKANLMTLKIINLKMFILTFKNVYEENFLIRSSLKMESMYYIES